jgi:hypothetical protein
MDNPNLAMEVQTRYILHWNYRGYEKLPEELLKYGSHVEEIYFKENGLKELPENLNTQLKHLSQLYLYGNRLHSGYSANKSFLVFLKLGTKILLVIKTKIKVLWKSRPRGLF